MTRACWAVDVTAGAPQCGHVCARIEICPPQSGQLVNMVMTFSSLGTGGVGGEHQMTGATNERSSAALPCPVLLAQAALDGHHSFVAGASHSLGKGAFLSFIALTI